MPKRKGGGDPKKAKRRKSDSDSDSDSDSTDSSSSSTVSSIQSAESNSPYVNVSNLECINLLESKLGIKLNITDRKFIKHFLSDKKPGLVIDTSYFVKLPQIEKNKLLKIMQQISNINVSGKPMVFKALQSDMPITAKADFVTKMITNTGGDIAKINTWMRALLRIPFGKYTEPLDTNLKTKSGELSSKKVMTYLKDAKNKLDKAVYGHTDTKQKILQIIAQNISHPSSTGLILGIQGGKGQGKTTIVENGIAEVLNKPFFHIALGGATDSSYLEGFSYTYEGSTHGRITDILMEAKVMDPVIYFDELDKVSDSYKGQEIINALMHLTDPSQNKKIQDKYFAGIDLDLSRATIIFSYNCSKYINPILMDRITEIRMNSFKIDEKIHIAKKFLIPSIVKEVGLDSDDIFISNSIIKFIVENYTLECGVRRLQQKLFEIHREINLRYHKGDEVSLPFVVTVDNLKNDLLAKHHFCIEKKIHDEPRVGLINGMYASDNEGGVLPIEVSEIPSKEKFEIEVTGMLGNVMTESTRVAKTVAWNNIPDEVKKNLQLNWKTYGTTGFHIHFPEGATNKDGPSAGLGITTALISFITKRKVKNTVSVTGEIDLNGNALIIGGLDQKLYGAKRAGVELALVPEENRHDVEVVKKEYPRLIKKGEFNVVFVKNIKDVLEHALED